MARIPDEEIERLKKEVPHRAPGDGLRHRTEAAWRGTDRAGVRFMTTRRRRLVVSPKTNLWHCLGACNVGRLDDRLGHEDARA